MVTNPPPEHPRQRQSLQHKQIRPAADKGLTKPKVRLDSRRLQVETGESEQSVQELQFQRV